MRVLVVDDDLRVAEFVSAILRDKGHDVSQFSDSVEALLAITCEEWDLAVTDIYMPDQDGLDILRAVRRCAAPFPVIAMSEVVQTWTTFDPLRCAREFGAAAILKKPFSPVDLLAVVNNVVEPSFDLQVVA